MPYVKSNTEDESTSRIANAISDDSLDLPAEEIAARTLRRLAQAKTLEEAFGAYTAPASQALVGHAYEVHSVTWGTYSAERGEIPLAEVDATDLATRERSTWITTARNLVAFLDWADRNDKFPVKFRVGEQITRNGRKFLVPEPVK